MSRVSSRFCHARDAHSGHASYPVPRGVRVQAEGGSVTTERSGGSGVTPDRSHQSTTRITGQGADVSQKTALRHADGER